MKKLRPSSANTDLNAKTQEKNFDYILSAGGAYGAPTRMTQNKTALGTGMGNLEGISSAGGTFTSKTSERIYRAKNFGS